MLIKCFQSLFIVLLVASALAATDPYESYDAPTGASRYVATTGNDSTGTGAIGAPYATLGKALSVASAGDEVVLRGGSYGSFSETSTSRTGWIVVRAYTGEEPKFSSFTVNYASLTPCYLRLVGITVENGTTAGLVYVLDAANFEFRDGLIRGTATKYDSGQAVTINVASNVLFYGTEVRTAAEGFVVTAADAAKIVKCHVHEIAGGSMIKMISNEILIERNHLHDSIYNTNDAGFPASWLPPGNPHGSGLSIRAKNVTARYNEIHDLGSTSGFRFYPPDGAGGQTSYDNILIENNVFYSLNNSPAGQILNCGTNVVIRNNTIIGYVRDISTGVYRMEGALSFTEPAATYSLTVENNILLGYVWVPSATTLRYNHIWSGWWTESAGTWWSSAPGTGNTLCTTGSAYPIDTFTNGYFAGVTSTNVFNKEYVGEVDYSITTNSAAYNAGSASYDTDYGMGSILDGFIQMDGAARGSSVHSWGAYEPDLDGADTTDPTVSIATPTSSATYSTTASSVSVGGTASDNVGVSSVSGSADTTGVIVISGTTTWSGTVDLDMGANVVTITATDAASNTGTDTITITRTEAPASGTMRAGTVRAGSIIKR
jgi:hypothetical protein